MFRNLLYLRLLSHALLIILMTCCFFDETTASGNLNYKACKQEKCGNVSIQYPFWTKSHFCGHKGFQIKCNDSQASLDLIFGLYLIQGNESIHYEKRFLELKARADFDASCLPNFFYPNDPPPPPPGTSQEYNKSDTIPLRKGVSGPDVNVHFRVHLFYKCDSSFSFPHALPLTCSSNRISKSYAALGQNEHPGNMSEKIPCKSLFSADFELEGNDLNKVSKTIDYKRLFRDNLTLHWTGEAGDQCRACQSSAGECRQFEAEECFCPDGSDPKICSKGNDDRRLKIGLGAGIGILAVIVIVLTIFMIRYRRMHASLKVISNNNSAENPIMSELACSHVYFEVPIFQNKELEEATKNFDSSQELGQGGFGTVYYGKLQDGREVAVKRLNEHNYRRVKQFMTEVRILARLQHKNLVSLYGCTSRQSHELLLVYEYVPNGTVADHLHGDQSKQGPLPWHIRMSIAVETARALAYLHASDIIHCDVKTNNILLDNNFGVKVGDFGLSRLFPSNATHISTAPQGTPGYVDPEYHLCYQLTEKSDVYSFAVVLMELVSSMPAVDTNRERYEINLAYLAINRIQKGAFHELVDPSLGYDSDATIRGKITGVIELAFMCLQHEKELRPSMVNVLEELEAIASATEVVAKKCLSPSQESDKAALLRNTNFSSPTSVTQKWISSNGSCTPTMSA